MLRRRTKNKSTFEKKKSDKVTFEGILMSEIKYCFLLFLILLEVLRPSFSVVVVFTRKRSIPLTEMLIRYFYPPSFSVWILMFPQIFLESKEVGKWRKKVKEKRNTLCISNTRDSRRRCSRRKKLELFPLGSYVSPRISSSPLHTLTGIFVGEMFVSL